MAAGLSGNHGRVPPQRTASVGVGSLGEASHLHGSMGLGSDGAAHRSPRYCTSNGMEKAVFRAPLGRNRQVVAVVLVFATGLGVYPHRSLRGSEEDEDRHRTSSCAIDLAEASRRQRARRATS
jgi:hypothetical protein